MAKVSVTKSKLDSLANAVAAKSGESIPLTVDEMTTAVLSIDTDIEMQSKTITPTELSQTVTADNGYDGLSSVQVGAISSTYIGSEIVQRSSTDLSASGDTVTVPSGYYESEATKAVASGTAGTPTASKSTVSNNSVTVTPSVTNTTGYITGGTKTGTGISVSASELVSGTYNVTSSGTKDVTNYASISVPSGSEGTPTATKGTVSNHAISVTPSVTNTGGYITGSAKTGTAVSISASELVSGTYNVSASGTVDVTNYENISVPSGTAGTPTATKGTASNGSITVTPSVTNTTGFITGSTKTGTAVTVSASELDSGTKSITANGTGIDVVGYASVDVSVSGGGGGSTRTTIVPEQTANYSERYNQINFVAPLVVGEVYIYTIDGVESQSMAFDNYGSVAIGSPETTIGFEYANGMMYLSIADSSLRGTHTVKVEQESSGGGGSSATLITKTITQNGTYDAEDDDADGYSSVTVNVSSGASNIVTGTFKGTTTGAAMDVNLNYSGSGYPIAVMIYLSNTDASTFQSTIQRYAVRDCMLDKYAKATSPTYSKTGAGDNATLTANYKSSSTNSANYSNGGSTAALYADEAATVTSISSIVKIRSKTKMSVFIASSSYGFMANIEYSYVVIYSS